MTHLNIVLGIKQRALSQCGYNRKGKCCIVYSKSIRENGYVFVDSKSMK